MMYQPRGPEPVQRQKKPSGRKLAGSLIVLGSSAVVSVYTVGYVSTQSSLEDLTTQVSPTAAVASSQGTSNQATSNQPAATSGGATTATQTPASATQASGYADGTYTGTGNSRHGSITVTVVIKDGEITSAAVTDCRTRYPCSDVNPLISAVLTNQKVPTNHVSGATDSSTAYKSAVSAALQKALAGV